MGWFNRRDDGLRDLLANINERLARLEQAASEQAPALQNTLQTFATTALESAGKNLESLGHFMSSISEIGISRAARQMGSRGGKKSGEARKARAAAAAKPACRLCNNPFVSNPTAAEIDAHQSHGQELDAAAQAELGITYHRDQKGIHAHVHESSIGVGADGGEQIDCPDCGPNGHVGH